MKWLEPQRGLFCNGAEICVSCACQAGTPPNCDDGVTCTDDSCNEGTDSCGNVANHANCDDGLFCDGAETCDPVLGCQVGTDPCPGGVCDEANDICEAACSPVADCAAKGCPCFTDSDCCSFRCRGKVGSMICK